MARKIKDLAVKVSTYTDNYGNEKGRYENVGALMQNDDGNQFLMLKRTFNIAGCPNPQARDSVLVSMFDPKQQSGGGHGSNSGGSQGASGGQSGGFGAGGGLDDEIPFMREDRL